MIKIAGVYIGLFLALKNELKPQPIYATNTGLPGKIPPL